MSTQYPGGFITKSPVAPTQSAASGIWTIDQATQNIKAGTWPSPSYTIQRSLRFNSADSARLTRTPASASNRRTWTYSGWVKRSTLSSTGVQKIFSAYFDGQNQMNIQFSSDVLMVIGATGGVLIIRFDTTAVYRDISAWYHVVVAVDTTQATSTNRVKIYVNGTQVTAFSTATYPTQNDQTMVNTTNTHLISSYDGVNDLYNGYMTEVNFIDGQALTPSSFGETNANTGVWGPKAYSGTYGTNGFYLNFSDNSNTTAATLGKDYSGNGNNWTPNNFSVATGAGNDSLVDSPTSYGADTGAGGTVRGNYATLNPLQIDSTYATLSNGNLQYVDTTAAGSFQAAYSTVFATSGKYYFEATVSSVSGIPYPSIGSTSPPVSLNSYIEKTATGYQGYGYYADGTKATNDTYTAFGATYTAGDTVSVAVDIDAGKVWFAKNGTWQASGDPAAGTNPAFNIVTGRPYGFAVGNGSSATSIQIDCNFGQRAWLYTAPSGYQALCTQNLPTPTIGATSATLAGKFFNPVLYTGNSTAPRAITGVGFQPDYVWTKCRSNSFSHGNIDSVRGGNKYLRSNLTDAEGTFSYISSFDSDGYTIGGSDGSNNANGETYVAWNWKAGGTGVSNTAGSITSTVSANTTSGFSVLTYTGTGAVATVGHGLGVVPQMIIVKSRSAVVDWVVYNAYTPVPRNNILYLSGTQQVLTVSNYWGTSDPTSSVFGLNTFGGNNASGGTYVAYCFAAVAGYSAFGNYTGNLSTDGPFVFTGFRPAYVMVKRTDAADQWTVYDSSRNSSNLTNRILYPNLSNAEDVGTDGIDMLSNGFKVRATYSNLNASGGAYIYIAFASNPFKYSLAR